MPNLEILAQHNRERLAKAKEQYLGIDFGFNHPSAMVKVGINRSLFKKTRELYHGTCQR